MHPTRLTWLAYPGASGWLTATDERILFGNPPPIPALSAPLHRLPAVQAVKEKQVFERIEVSRDEALGMFQVCMPLCCREHGFIDPSQSAGPCLLALHHHTAHCPCAGLAAAPVRWLGFFWFHKLSPGCICPPTGEQVQV